MSQRRILLAFLTLSLCAIHAAAQPLSTTRQWATQAFAGSEYSSTSWSANRATGVPDTETDGDHPSAWAPARADGGAEWIELVYTLPVIPTQINVRETCGPGFVTKIEAYDYESQGVIGGTLPRNAQGKWVLLWEGTDPTTQSPGTFSPKLGEPKLTTNRIRLTVDTLKPGWNEIDAVELVGSHAPGSSSLSLTRQWAFQANASSQYDTDSWSAQQATGAPNTMRDGDYSTAWAPARKNGTVEWIELFYPRPAIPTQIAIRETCNPGFVTQVEGFDVARGGWVILWKGQDTTNESPGVFSPPLTNADFRTDHIRIFINTSVPGWNEMDAVELIGRVPN